MWKHYFFQAKYRRAWMIVELCIFLFCALHVLNTYITNIHPDMVASKSFKKTYCFIVKKRLSTRGLLLTQYRSDFFVSYYVQGQQYSRWVSGNGLDNSFKVDETAEEDLLSQLDIGVTYPCWYDPNDPTVAMLTKRQHWAMASTIILPSLVGLITFYLLWRRFRQRKKV